MNLYDRFLTVRRAVIVASKPSTKTVMIGYTNKENELKIHNIHTDYDKGKKTYLSYWKNLFIKHSDSAESVKTKLINFNKEVQDDWNNLHRNDPLRLITTKVTEFKSDSKDRLMIKNMFGDWQLTIKRMIKVLLLNKQQAFAEVYPDDVYYLNNVDSLIDKFMAKMNSVYYTTNGLKSDSDFAIAVNHQPFAYVLWLARKSGKNVDYVFNNMPSYYKIKMIDLYINQQLKNSNYTKDEIRPVS